MKRLVLVLVLACGVVGAPFSCADTHVYVRGAHGWAPAQARVDGAAVAVHLDPALVGGQAEVLISEAPLDVDDTAAPFVAALSLNGHEFRAPVPADLGFFPWPHTIAVMLHDSGSHVTQDSVQVTLVGERTGPAVVPCPVTSFSQGAWVRATLDTRDLRADRYTLRISAADLLGNRLDTAIRLDSLGIVIPATTLKVSDSSGRLSKPLPEIGTQFYHGESAGDFVSYSLPVERAGQYGISVHFTRCYSYGTYMVSLDGEREPHPLDGYDPDLRVGAGSLNLGRRYLSAGEHCLRFELFGKNPAAQSRFLGLTEVVLRPEPGVAPHVLRRP